MVPRGGKDATRNEEKLKQWFPAEGVNVGIRVTKGFVILDIETKNGGMEQLAEWERLYGPMPITPTAQSGSGGRHYYFKTSIQFKKEKVRLASGAELLTGGDVIAPPSSHESGGWYSWIYGLETPLALLPQWIFDLIVNSGHNSTLEIKVSDTGDKEGKPFDPMKGTISAGETFADLGNVPDGMRNEPVNSVIGSMLGNGFTREQILEEGLMWARQQEPPYSESDLTDKVEFFGRKESVEAEGIGEELLDGEPRTVPTFPRSQFAGSQAANSDNDKPPTPVEPSSRLSDEAYYGIVGEYVSEVGPLVEADPAGIMACLLTGCGSSIGRTVHHLIGRRHSANLFLLLTGHTTARKGTCWDVAEELLKVADPEWNARCVENGFGSGQGFIDRIRDASGEDEGVKDKRLLIVEEEFVKVLRLCRSETSILSPLIRAAFDGKPLTVLNRGENRYGCREPHASIIGMTTAEELLIHTKGRSELVNGTVTASCSWNAVGAAILRLEANGEPWRANMPPD